MAEIVAIGASTGAACDVGGIAYAYATEISNVTGVTVGSDREVTNFTMSSTGLWAKLTPDDGDNVAFYNEVSALVGRRVEVTGSATLAFDGLSIAKIKSANLAMACCGVAVIWVFNSGVRRIQGIEVDNAGAWKATSLDRCKITADANSGTGADKSTLVYNFTSRGRFLSPVCTLTDTAIEAL